MTTIERAIGAMWAAYDFALGMADLATAEATTHASVERKSFYEGLACGYGISASLIYEEATKFCAGAVS